MAILSITILRHSAFQQYFSFCIIYCYAKKEKNMKFIYRALKPGGEEINGDIEAPDEQTAKKEIRNFGLFPIKISP